MGSIKFGLSNIYKMYEDEINDLRRLRDGLPRYSKKQNFEEYYF
jgi:hypothetical protein